VLSGLTQPHHPRWVHGTWVLCNSGSASLDAYDEHGTLLRRALLPRYPRGLAIGTRAVFVGSSTNRSVPNPRPPAVVTVLDRADWSVIGTFALEWPEIYDLAIVPRELVAGVATGFRTNPSRVRQHDQFAMFAAAGVQPKRLWAVGEPLPHASLRATIDADVPPAMRAGEIITVPCRITNRGDALFVTAPPNPVHVCYRWYDGAGKPVGAGTWLHTPLGYALPPGEMAAGEFRVRAPEEPGRYTLAASLLQAGVAWFDDVDPSSGQRTGVDVERGANTR
jgi:acetolactate synthase-1/2/3 large subunit